VNEAQPSITLEMTFLSQRAVLRLSDVLYKAGIVVLIATSHCLVSLSLVATRNITGEATQLNRYHGACDPSWHIQNRRGTGGSSVEKV
jgi:hypothetical protein